MTEIERQRTSGIHDITHTKKKIYHITTTKKHNDEIGDMDLKSKKKGDSLI
jgi:hypothetical protein